MAKCGPLVAWHWAHETKDCDPWYEPESEWHLQWKGRFPPDWQEVSVGGHRADVRTPTLVVELQASAISAEDISAREAHYGNMIWLLRGEDFKDNLRLRKRDGYMTFRWLWPRKTWWCARKPLLVDMGDGRLFLVKKLHPKTPCGGWGVWVTEAEFFKWCGLG